MAEIEIIHKPIRCYKRSNKQYLPFATVVLNDSNKTLYEISRFIEKQEKIEDKPTVYICENLRCYEPTNKIDRFIFLLRFKTELIKIAENTEVSPFNLF